MFMFLGGKGTEIEPILFFPNPHMKFTAHQVETQISFNMFSLKS